MDFNTPPEVVIAWILVLFLGIGFHEYAHCKVADMAGDPTPRYYGRVTLNLFKHFEPTGTIMMIISAFTGIGLGWGRPAPINPTKMKNPRWDTFAAVAAGPASNFVQAAVYAGILRLWVAVSPLSLGGFFGIFLLIGIYANLSLMLFNLIPFGPLDGHWLVGELLPEKQRYYWYRFNRTIGMFGLIIVITILNQIARSGGPDIVGMIITGPRERIAQFLTGIHPQ
jgi:Zn-dependent protease